MTPEQIEAERVRFISTRSSRNHPERGFGDAIIDPESCGWLARAEIAHAEKAELVAERDKLRDWKESAMSVLSDWHEVWERLGKPGTIGSSKAMESLKEVERLRAELAEIHRAWGMAAKDL